MKQSVLDSYAILAYLLGEPGADIVENLLTEAKTGKGKLWCCWVNMTEVYYSIVRRSDIAQAHDTLLGLLELPIEFIPADRDISIRAAEMKTKCRFSLGDAFAAATALTHQASVVTGDPEFAQAEDNIPVIWLGKRAPRR